ncbi:aminopeptidase I zinc metalloprotease-domain-containing protein [Scheffersomyces amazonensis]|uniref:aminopeptidase I zinc metalloprotease-domain-containing protein n=1 Tax=Scheffersomyces amazonensis TaxID=1078765 RepID=UPI00315C6C27
MSGPLHSEEFTIVTTNDNGVLSTTDDYSDYEDYNTEEEYLTDKEQPSEYILQMPKFQASDSNISQQFTFDNRPVQVIENSTPFTSDSEEKATDFADYYDTYADKFIEFMNYNPTTYHTVLHFKSLLENNGFKYIKENELINLEGKPGFYFTSKDDLTLIAFVIGGKWKPSNGSCFIGSHCDALSVKINPHNSTKVSSDKESEPYELLGVAPYSGALNHLWLNRDLALAGAVLVKDQQTKKVTRKLVNSFPHPVGFIPQLAPHFGLPEKEYNTQTEMVPIISYKDSNVYEELKPTEEEKSSILYNRHSLGLLRYVTELSQSSLSSIVALDLDLVDSQPAIRGGLDEEFIYSSSLDDRLCSFDSIYGLIEFSQKFYKEGNDIESYDGFNGIYLSNHEEIGSATRTGAKGGFLIDIFKSIVSTKTEVNPQEALLQLTHNSVLLSTDVTHALNPNFKNVYLEHNFPLPNVGPSIKFDSNMHVLSDSSAYVFLQDIITNHLPDIKLQHFHIRNDSRSGGTIGPILSDSLRGINGAKLIIDVGLPILSMHSIRSIMGYKDVGIGIRFFKEVFNRWQESVKIID